MPLPTTDDYRSGWRAALEFMLLRYVPRIPPVLLFKASHAEPDSTAADAKPRDPFDNPLHLLF